MLRLLALLLLLATPLAAASAQQASPPWGVAPVPIEHRAVSFMSGGVRIAGTLWYPRGGRHLPAVVALHGASMPLEKAKLYDHLREMLPPLGIAVLTYDRRGEGASGGNDKRKNDFDLLADDAVAARKFVAADPMIDAKRSGYWGLSQGGWLAVLAAAKDPQAAFVISVSAPMAGAAVQMNYAVTNILRVKGYAQADIDQAVATRDAVDAFVLGKADRASAERALAAARPKPWFKLIYLEGNIDDPAWPGQIRADPLKALDMSKVPTLMIYGQLDPWVPVGPSLDALAASAARHPHVRTTVINGADHMMMLGVDPKLQMEPASFPDEAPDAPAYFAAMASWLAERGIGRVAAR